MMEKVGVSKGLIEEEKVASAAAIPPLILYDLSSI